MNLLLKEHFNVQTGMYFDNSITYKDWVFFMSNTIEDGFWNYAVIPEDCNIEKELAAIEDIFINENRLLSVYVVNENEHPDYVAYLLKHGYSKMAQESFMTYNLSTYNRSKDERTTIVRAIGKTGLTDFVDVFTSAYGGEVTPEQPYGELDKAYVDALIQSFKNTEKFYHYVCYINEKPVAIASLCYENGNGGIYNVGTKDDARGCGYGTSATLACIEKWKELGGETLFLQTETGSRVESWYYSLGFKVKFYGSTYCKEGK